MEVVVFFFSSRRRHTRFDCDWSSDVCSSDLFGSPGGRSQLRARRSFAREFQAGQPETRRLLRLPRSEEHTSELQSQSNLVCRLLLEKKKRDNHARPLSFHGIRRALLVLRWWQ